MSSAQPRAVDFDSGRLMIVTDLHGAGSVYFRLRDQFLKMRQSGEVDCLVLCGDLIHGYAHESQDSSLEMLLDVMRLQAELGAEMVIMLLGNHEMPHIYDVTLSKGEIEFTPRFERALVKLDESKTDFKREDVICFLKSLPFYVRTKAGVLISHAGASPAIQTVADAENALEFDHDALLRNESMRLADVSIDALRSHGDYAVQVRHALGIEDVTHPRFIDLLRGMLISQNSGLFQFLWDILFTYNEQEGGADRYRQTAERFLKSLSAVSAYEQRVIVAGHISARGGYQLVGREHFRLASFAHSVPSQSGKYLLLDSAKPVQEAADLVENLRPVFEP